MAILHCRRSRLKRHRMAELCMPSESQPLQYRQTWAPLNTTGGVLGLTNTRGGGRGAEKHRNRVLCHATAPQGVRRCAGDAVYDSAGSDFFLSSCGTVNYPNTQTTNLNTVRTDVPAVLHLQTVKPHDTLSLPLCR